MNIQIWEINELYYLAFFGAFWLIGLIMQHRGY